MGSLRDDVGVQFTVHIANRYSVPELVELAETAHGLGFSQVWVNDNLRYRNVFTVLTAIASQVPIRVGTAVMVPYYRNPLDVADMIAAISELNDAGEVGIGIGRGDLAQTGSQVETPRPYRMIRETVECLRALLDGEPIRFGDYALLADYFNLKPETRIEMAFEPSSPVGLYMGGHGPVAATVAGKFMDGLLLGGFFTPLLRTGRLSPILDTAAEAAASVDRGDRLANITEINVSIAEDPAEAKAYPKPHVAHLLMDLKVLGLTDADFEQLGIEPGRVAAIVDALSNGVTIEEVGRTMVTDAMVDATVVNGDIDSCAAELLDLIDAASDAGFERVVLAKIGPDYEYALSELSAEVLPLIDG